MFPSKLAAAAATALVVLTCAGTLPAAADGRASLHEKAAIATTQTSLSRAVAAAEQKTGGRATRVHLAQQDGVYLYRVKTIANDRTVEAMVDARTGEVVETREPGMLAWVFRLFDREEAEDRAMLSAWPSGLAGAIAVAEKATGGMSIEAEFEGGNDKAVFEIVVAKEGGVQKVTIEGATGKILSVGSAKQRAEGED